MSLVDKMNKKTTKNQQKKKKTCKVRGYPGFHVKKPAHFNGVRSKIQAFDITS